MSDPKTFVSGVFCTLIIMMADELEQISQDEKKVGFFLRIFAKHLRSDNDMHEIFERNTLDRATMVSNTEIPG